MPVLGGEISGFGRLASLAVDIAQELDSLREERVEGNGVFEMRDGTGGITFG